MLLVTEGKFCLLKSFSVGEEVSDFLLLSLQEYIKRCEIAVQFHVKKSMPILLC